MSKNRGMHSKIMRDYWRDIKTLSEQRGTSIKSTRSTMKYIKKRSEKYE